MCSKGSVHGYSQQYQYGMLCADICVLYKVYMNTVNNNMVDIMYNNI